MARRHARPLLCLVLLGAVFCTAQAGEPLAPAKARPVDPAKAKSQELEKQRLLAKLHADAPKVADSQGGGNPLDAPIFHRYDRPWVAPAGPDDTRARRQ